MIETQLILSAGVIIFSIAALLFFVLTGLKKKSVYSYAFLVSIITLISNLVMLDGSIVAISSVGEPLYYTRWLGYIASCTLLMYSISKVVNIPQNLLTRLMYLTGITMVTGALASVASGSMMLGYFIIGGITYILMIVIISSKGANKLSWISKYVHLGWSVFPIIFILSPEGYGVVTLSVSIISYLILDIFTKIVFYLELGKRSLDNL
ncbi:MAG: sensory rhodopsin [Candidatus Paceibacteria bacterium]|jgi:bacteriorhodopsin